MHSVCENLSDVISDLINIIPFHAITGCDTVSHIVGHTKKTAWKVFCENENLLKDLGVGILKEATVKSAEQFICKLY